MRSRSRTSLTRLPAAVVATLIACLVGLTVAGPAHAQPLPATYQAHKNVARVHVSAALPSFTDQLRPPVLSDAATFGTVPTAHPSGPSATLVTADRTADDRSAPSRKGRDPPARTS